MSRLLKGFLRLLKRLLISKSPEYEYSGLIPSPDLGVTTLNIFPSLWSLSR